MMEMTMRPVALPWKNVMFESSADGSLRVRNSTRLGPYPVRLTERLRHWAAVAPDRVLFASRDGERWRKVTYLEALNSACAIGQALLDRDLSITRPALILSGNGIEHGLLSLGCLHVGIPFVPLPTAYSLISTDFARLRDIVALVRPGLVFADDGDRYAAALRACIPQDVEVVILRRDPGRCAPLRCFARYRSDERRGGCCHCRQSRYGGQAAIYLWFDRNPERRDQHAPDVVQRPADGVGVLPRACRGASRASRLVALEPYHRWHHKFRHRTVQ